MFVFLYCKCWHPTKKVGSAVNFDCSTFSILSTEATEIQCCGARAFFGRLRDVQNTEPNSATDFSLQGNISNEFQNIHMFTNSRKENLFKPQLRTRWNGIYKLVLLDLKKLSMGVNPPGPLPYTIEHG